MNAKHLTKFSISKKLTFFGVAIAVAIIAAFSICATTQAYSLNIINEDGITLEDITINCKDTEVHLCNVSGWAKTDIDWKESNWSSGDSMAQILQKAELNPDLYKAKSCGFYIENTEKNEYGETEYTLNFKVNDVPDYYDENHIAYLKLSLTTTSDDVWKVNGKIVTEDELDQVISNLDQPVIISFESKDPVPSGINVSGHVANSNDVLRPVPGAFVQYCHWTPWGSVPVEGMNTFTDWFGNYTIEGVTEDMLPGVIRVYRFGYEVAETDPIWFVPEGLDTIYRFVEMTPTEPPVPPTPPDPPVPPVPPQPDPPQPVPPTPVPPTPVPTPVDPGTNVPQTGDNAAIALAIASILALCGACTFGACAKRRKFSN